MVKLAPSGACFPLKAPYDQANLTLAGREASQRLDGGDPLAPPPEALPDPEVRPPAFAPPPHPDSTPSGAVDPPRAVRVDSLGRRYPVDEYGDVIRKSTRPKGVPSAAWNTLTPKQKADMIARCAARERERAAMGAADSRGDPPLLPPSRVRPISGMRSGSTSPVLSSRLPPSPVTLRRGVASHFPRFLPRFETLVYVDPTGFAAENGIWALGPGVPCGHRWFAGPRRILDSGVIIDDEKGVVERGNGWLFRRLRRGVSNIEQLCIIRKTLAHLRVRLSAKICRGK